MRLALTSHVRQMPVYVKKIFHHAGKNSLLLVVYYCGKIYKKTVSLSQIYWCRKFEPSPPTYIAQKHHISARIFVDS